jgi:hypothetical protein
MLSCQQVKAVQVAEASLGWIDMSFFTENSPVNGTDHLRSKEKSRHEEQVRCIA